MKNKLKTLNVLFIILFSSILFESVYAEDPILISISSDLDQVIFDGKWTHVYEWKQSSYNRLVFDDGNEIHLRTGHQDNFIYVHINFASDTNIEKGSDSAIICFDTKNDKTMIPQSDDYCFSTTLDTKNSFTYRGNNNPSIDDSFDIIPNDKNFVGVGTTSDKYDRYSKVPHTSYEFRIPLDVLGRSDNYGFYVSVYDGDSQNHYSWPYEIKNQTSFSSPNQWGDLVSPDKSLPEFNLLVMFSLIFSLMAVSIIITKLNVFKINTFRY
ncbi:hypothetical protein [Nitrosopumilus sp.]|uniref:hypothetical protein n=1 Tax=Nitrosopumilus sp. TaxID=2024843 RepID=UPI00247DF954|nr:hypothetical protein [Nitrosopumilus sp.]MCV0410644.1 hypothetical protein [Nitrosopumilus sp.]